MRRFVFSTIFIAHATAQLSCTSLRKIYTGAECCEDPNKENAIGCETTHYANGRVRKIHTFLKDILGTLPIPTIATHSELSGAAVTVRSGVSLRPAYKDVPDTMVMFTSMYMAIAEVINQHILPKPASIAIDPRQAEALLGTSNNFYVECDGTRHSVGAMTGYRSTDAQLWGVYPEGLKSVIASSIGINASLVPDYMFTLDRAYRNGCFTSQFGLKGPPMASLLSLKAFGMSDYFRMPDGRQIYQFINIYGSHLVDVILPFLPKFAEAFTAGTDGFGDYSALLWKRDTNTGAWERNENSEVVHRSISELPEGAWPGTPATFDTHVMIEYIATYLLADKNGNRDDSNFGIVQTPEEYAIDAGSTETDDLITVEAMPINHTISPLKLSGNWSYGGPLKGVKVLAMVKAISTPSAAHMMAQFGAEVIFVIDPRENGFSAFESAYYSCGTVVGLDLRNTADKEKFLELIAQSHVFLTNNKPESMARLGLDATTLAAHASSTHGLSIVEQTAFGPGNYLNRKGYADTIASTSGLIWSLGRARKPLFIMPFAFFMDQLGTMMAALACTSALALQTRKGGVYYVQTGMGKISNFAATRVAPLIPEDWQNEDTNFDDVAYKTFYLPNFGVKNEGWNYFTNTEASISPGPGSQDWTVGITRSPYYTANGESADFAELRLQDFASMSNVAANTVAFVQ